MKVFLKVKPTASADDWLEAMEAANRPLVKSSAIPDVVVADLDDQELAKVRGDAAYEVYEDIQFAPVTAPARQEWWERLEPPVGEATPPVWMTKTQDDIMRHNRADEAWESAEGAGVTIAVVDTGIHESVSEIPRSRRSEHSLAPSFGERAWEDPKGHGTMCAAVAAGSRTQAPGKYKGVAPKATVLSARTTFRATDLYAIYEHLLTAKKQGKFGKGLVVSNSYGLYVCQSAGIPEDHPYVELVRACVAGGIVFVFAAGNNHAGLICQHAPGADGPNTIWSVNSIDEVITVGTVNWNESNQEQGEHANSSRGPGEWSIRRDKPDVVAPTYGDVVWGGGYTKMEWWGTSGACPQVAGLAALMLSVNPNLTPDQIRGVIRSTAKELGGPAACVGAGLIDCAKAVRGALNV